MELAAYSLKLTTRAKALLREAGIHSHIHAKQVGIDPSLSLRAVEARVRKRDSRGGGANIRSFFNGFCSAARSSVALH